MIPFTSSASASSLFEKPWGNYLLEKIVETPLPNAISWLPQTPGWQLVALIGIVLLIKKGYLGYKSYQHNAYRREALKWLKNHHSEDNIDYYKQLPVLLRKTALMAFQRSEVNQLSGKNWENWLDKRCQQTQFSSRCPNVLYQLAYMPIIEESFKVEQYKTLIEQITLWIKYHKGSND